MFEDLPQSELNSPSFKEDSVRELIITPILSRLGFNATGPNKVVRSKTLVHPFIFVGTRQHAVSTIPDYTLYHNDKALLVLDAKAPTEDITSRAHVQQAYSYAIHPEIKASYFSLCNGRTLVVFDLAKADPIFRIEFDSYSTNWQEIERYLSPRFLLRPALRNYKPDLGMAYKKLGFGQGTRVNMIEVKLGTFLRANADLMSISMNCLFAEQPHCISLDFEPRFLSEILECLPVPLAAKFSAALDSYPFHANADMCIELDLDARIGADIQLEDEVIAPFKIERVFASRYISEHGIELANDVPENIFRLGNYSRR